MEKLPEYLRFGLDCKSRRKDKEVKFLPASRVSDSETPSAYLTEPLTSRQLQNVNFTDIIISPNIDEKEWIISNVVAFVGLVDSIYDCFEEYCTDSICSKVDLPTAVEVYWPNITDQSKIIRTSSPRYIEYLLAFCFRLIDDNNIFPTVFGEEFPLDKFDLNVKRISKCLVTILAHIYHSHLYDLENIELLSYVNTFTLHVFSFYQHFNLFCFDAESGLDVLFERLKSAQVENETTEPSGSDKDNMEVESVEMKDISSNNVSTSNEPTS